jgi:hypothetical protein
MNYKRHIIIGSIIFIINTIYNFFADGWLYHNYYAPITIFLEKPTLIVLICILLLKWTKLLAIKKRIIYIYIYYSLLYYGSGLLGNILGIYFELKIRRIMGF